MGGITESFQPASLFIPSKTHGQEGSLPVEQICAGSPSNHAPGEAKF